MLKLFKRSSSPYHYIRGTVGGQSVFESTGVTDKKIAEEIRIKRENEILTEKVWGKAKTYTFAHAVKDYLEHAGGSDDGDTGRNRFLAPILKHFGTTLLRDIDQHAIDLAAVKLYPKAGPATRSRQVFTPTVAVLNHAARKKWCERPIIARPKQPKGVIRWLKPDEAERLIAECPRHLKPLVIFLLYTGARAGEAVWLDWSNVDLGKAQVTFPRTKNGEPRSVPLHPRILAELAAVKEKDRTGNVFRTPSGEPYAGLKNASDTSAGSRIHTAFSAACKRAKIEDCHVHTLRHSWASWMMQSGGTLAELRELGGWKTASMVFRYAHVNVAHHANAIGKLPCAKPEHSEMKIS